MASPPSKKPTSRGLCSSERKRLMGALGPLAPGTVPEHAEGADMLL